MPGWRLRWRKAIPTSNQWPATSAAHAPHQRARNQKPHSSRRHHDAVPGLHPSAARLELRARECRWPSPACGGCDGLRRVHGCAGIRCSRVCDSRTLLDLKIGIPQRSRQVVTGQISGSYSRLARALVAQIIVQARKRLRFVGFAVAVNDIQPLSGVGMKKMQLVGNARTILKFWLSGRGELPHRNQNQEKKTGNNP